MRINRKPRCHKNALLLKISSKGNAVQRGVVPEDANKDLKVRTDRRCEPESLTHYSSYYWMDLHLVTYQELPR